MRRADEVLQFTDRAVAHDDPQGARQRRRQRPAQRRAGPRELYVKACFADEGPTLKRFTPAGPWPRQPDPQAHLPHHVVLGVLDDDRLEVVQAREARRTAAGRRRRAAAAAPPPSPPCPRRAQPPARRRRPDAATGEPPTTTEIELPAGAVRRSNDGRLSPEGFEIKGNADSMLYHVPGSRFYDQTVAEVWFATAEDAEAAGYQLPPSQRDDEADESADARESADDERRARDAS